MQNQAPQQVSASVEYPHISEWLCYCDSHQHWQGDNLCMYIPKFSDQGYWWIDQIAQATVEQLSDWLGIGKGIADLLIAYVKEDVRLVSEGRFLMTIAAGNNGGTILTSSPPSRLIMMIGSIPPEMFHNTYLCRNTMLFATINLGHALPICRFFAFFMNFIQ